MAKSVVSGSQKKTPKKVSPPVKRGQKLTPEKGQVTIDSFFKKRQPEETTTTATKRKIDFASTSEADKTKKRDSKRSTKVGEEVLSKPQKTSDLSSGDDFQSPSRSKLGQKLRLINGYSPNDGRPSTSKPREEASDVDILGASPPRPATAKENVRRLSPRLLKSSMRAALNAFEKAKRCQRNPFQDCESWPKPDLARVVPDANGRGERSECGSSKENEATENSNASVTTSKCKVIDAIADGVPLDDVIPPTPEIKPKKMKKAKPKKRDDELASHDAVDAQFSRVGERRKRHSDDGYDDAGDADSIKYRKRLKTSVESSGSDLETEIPCGADSGASQGFEPHLNERDFTRVMKPLCDVSSQNAKSVLDTLSLPSSSIKPPESLTSQDEIDVALLRRRVDNLADSFVNKRPPSSTEDERAPTTSDADGDDTSANLFDSTPQSSVGRNEYRETQGLEPSDLADLLDASFDEPFEEPFEVDDSVDPTPCADYGRHIVVAVERSESEVRLELEEWSTKERRTVSLRDFWVDTLVEEGNVVNVIGSFTNGYCCIDSQGDNFLVVSPDTLINGTAVAGAIKCCRKTVLNEAFKGLESGNIHMLKGTVLHLIFQQALKTSSFDLDSLRKTASAALTSDSVLNDLVQIGVDEADFKKQIEDSLVAIKVWAERTISRLRNETPPNKPDGPPEVEGVEVEGVTDIEENFWSPLLGLKGKVDCSTEVTLHRRCARRSRETLPLELKTGKAAPNAEHNGQVSLYSLLFNKHRPDRVCEGGLLVYLQGASSTYVPRNSQETQALIQQRNRIAAHVRRGTRDLPEPVTNERTCKWCPHQMSCVLYKKIEKEDSGRLPIGGPSFDTVAHLTSSHAAYFAKWSRLIATEAATDGKGKKNSHFWCRTPEEQERSGWGLSRMILCQAERISGHDGVLHTFNRPSSPLVDNAFGVGDSVAATPMKPRPWRNRLAIGVGTVKSSDRKRIQIILDRDLRELLPEVESWRLDRVEMYDNSAASYVNLIRLMEDSPRMKRLRELLIDFKPPTSDRTCHRNLIVKTKSLLRSLNLNQQQASLRSLMAHDYVLIRGMPGAGKTSTIVALVRVLVTIGASVLLTSFTHSAVDNILLKLVDTEVSFLRLGRKHRIHSKLAEFGADAALESLRRERGTALSAGDVSTMYSSFSVVATTCLGLKHPAIAGRTFDYCIVDEASQVLQPVCLGPLFHAKKFILVGDPQQLPPIVTSREALKDGMDESLMMSLMNSPGKCLVDLNVQYRMNSVIMRLANEVVYEGLLECGDVAVENATLRFQQHDAYLEDNFGRRGWMTTALSGALSAAALFLSTRAMKAFDSSVAGDGHKGLTNVKEAALVKRLCQALVGGGVSVDSIGVITPYRSQVAFLKSFLASPFSATLVSQSSTADSKSTMTTTQSSSPTRRCAPFAATMLDGVEINTVDQYQGRDKSIVIVSFVRSRPSLGNSDETSQHSGEETKESMPTTILHDLRRLNVAITRAKHKIILIGDPVTLNDFPPLAAVLASLAKNGAVISLPESAHEDDAAEPVDDKKKI